MQKTQKSEKTITFYMKNCKKERFCFVFLWFFAFWTRGTLRNPIFAGADQLEVESLYLIWPMRTPISTAVGEQVLKSQKIEQLIFENPYSFILFLLRSNFNTPAFFTRALRPFFLHNSDSLYLFEMIS